MKTIRSFLAVNLEISTVRSIAAEQIRLKDICQDVQLDVKWVAPQNMHVTISFLGDITEPMIQAIKDSFEPMCRAFPPFEFKTSGLGVFHDEKKPPVIWVGIEEENGQLDHLHKEAAKILDDIGFKREDKPFKSHVTIGRVKSSQSIPEDLLKLEEPTVFGKSRVKDLLCYRSDLLRKGADYFLHWKLPLLGRATHQQFKQPASFQALKERDNDDK